MRINRKFLAACAALCAAAAAAPAQEGMFDDLAPRVCDEYVYFEEMVPSGEDGVRLLTRIYLPEGEGPFPMVVTRTPYVWGQGDYVGIAREYARHGIGYIQQDCRGKGGSEGFFSPNVNERADGIALYEWLAEQPWCGDIGIFGSSYTALTGWLVGDSIPDKVKGMYLSHYGATGWTGTSPASAAASSGRTSCPAGPSTTPRRT